MSRFRPSLLTTLMLVPRAGEQVGTGYRRVVGQQLGAVLAGSQLHPDDAPVEGEPENHLAAPQPHTKGRPEERPSAYPEIQQPTPFAAR